MLELRPAPLPKSIAVLDLQVERWNAMTAIREKLYPCRQWGVLFILLLLGCTAGNEAKIESLETPLAEQILAVQQGASHEIRSNALITDVDFRLLQGLDKLEVLSLQRADLTDGIAETLRSLVGLRQLRLEQAQVADKTADAIGHLVKLVTINLPHSKISDKGLETWPALTDLILLRIGSPLLSNQALETVGRMNQLRFLHLINVPLTDAGLEYLHGMKQLESFYLDGGAATDQGLAELIKALPELHFHRDQQHIPNDPQADEHGKR